MDVGPVKLEVQHPAAMLYHACFVSASFRNMVRRAVAKAPPSPAAPWNFIFYADEISPGNQLAHKNKRKVWGFYCSLLEFGSTALDHEAS